MDVKEEELQALYDYVDQVPLSRPKRNIARDFADGVLLAELVHHEAPRAVDLHNYSAANSLPQKIDNWCTLNQRVFRRHLGFELAKTEIEAVCTCEAGAVERILKLLKIKLEGYKRREATERRDTPAKRQGHEPARAPSGPCLRSAERSSSAERPGMTTQIGGRAVKSAAEPTASVTLTVSKPPHDKGPTPADIVIRELRETNDLLSLRAEKLEELLRLKDAKIEALAAQLSSATVS